MTEQDLYERYCNQIDVAEEVREEQEELLKRTLGWQLFVFGVAVEELAEAVKASMPRWLRKFI